MENAEYNFNPYAFEKVEAIVYEYQARLRAFIFSRVGDINTAQDIAQDVFLVVFRQIDKYDPARPVWPWLMGIARNKLLEFWRARTKSQGECYIDDYLAEHWLNENTSLTDAHEDRLEALHRCVDKLAPDARRIVELVYLNHLKMDEVAESLKRKAGAIRVALFRIRNWLSNCIKKTTVEATA